MISLIKKKGINPQDKSTLYFPQWTRVSTITETQLAKRMARGSAKAKQACLCVRLAPHLQTPRGDTCRLRKQQKETKKGSQIICD